VQHWALNAPMPTARFSFALIAPTSLSHIGWCSGCRRQWQNLRLRWLRFRAIIDTYSSVTNTVTINDGAGMIFERSKATTPPRRYLCLPLIFKQ
jgi:hypothetical protein